MPGAATTPGISTPAVLSRAVFLACSWTWCIGMFFPVYLIGDFGFRGWVAFAVPNVLGAGAMGWVLRRPGASERITRDHAAACRWFSLATILFQLMFLASFTGRLLHPSLATQFFPGVIAVVIVLLSALALSLRSSPFWWPIALVTYAASFVAAACAGALGGILGVAPPQPLHTPTELACVVPALAFGFALCPYLDLTFHRVRAETPGRRGEAAFWLGFIVFFTPMISLTLLYASGFLSGTSLGPFILAHIVFQITFTVGAHLRELHEQQLSPEAAAAPPRAIKAWMLFFPPIFCAFLPALGDFRPGYPYTRLAYELFMSLYGLVFPAYVWIVVVPRSLERHRAVIAWFAAILPAGVCFWLGYVQQHYAWLIPGVMFPLVAPALARLATGAGANADATPRA